MPISVLDRSKIELQDITIDYNDNNNQNAINFTSSQIGKYPYIYYKGFDIDPNDIISFTLNNNKFVPYLEIEFRDKSDLMWDENFPIDNEIISLYIRTYDDVTMPIRMDFKILEIDIIKPKPGEKNDKIFKLTGQIDIDSLYYCDFFSKKGTSFNVLRNIANDNDLGYASNVENSNDDMTWINPSSSNADFIYEITKHSYISDNSFIWSFVDFYYNLNYIDIEKIFKEDISEQQSTTNYNYFNKDNQSQKNMNLILTNHPDYLNSNLYLNKFYLSNSSTKINLEEGYRKIVYYYNKNIQNLNKITVDSLSFTEGNSIIMKDTSKSNLLYKNLVKKEYTGKIDTDNVHENYNFALVQNKFNLNFLQKLNMVVYLREPNFSLYRFQKVNIEIYKLSKLDTVEDQSRTFEDPNQAKHIDDIKLNNKLSGEWIITGIRFIFNKYEGNIQELTLVKREITAFYNKK